MIFRQLTHDDLGCASYLIGDDSAGIAAVVDPRLDIDEYLRLARYLGVRIEHVLETHNHADHVSGHGRLVAATGATVHIHRAAEAEYDHEPFEDGWELELGDVVVRAIHTPGHRPEHTAFALVDTARGDEPWAVLSGDSLFVGDIARPDLAVDKEEGAHDIYRSLHEKLLPLPDTCEVWPGHLGGSLCGGPGMDLKTSTTIGYEREHQDLLAIDDEDDFVRQTTAGLGPQPPNFKNIVALNQGPLVRETVEAHPLNPRQVQQALADGAAVIDVRTELQYDEAHIPGSLCITARRAGFGSKLAWLAVPEQPLVLVGRDDDDALEAAGLAAAVGLRNVAGYLSGGMTSWREDKLDVDRIERVTVPELHTRWSDEEERPQVLDVREQDEWEAGHIPGAVHEPYHDIDDVPDGIDPSRPVAVICGSGQRAAVGASLLQRYGATDVIHVVDGGVPHVEAGGLAHRAARRLTGLSPRHNTAGAPVPGFVLPARDATTSRRAKVDSMGFINPAPVPFDVEEWQDEAAPRARQAARAGLGGERVRHPVRDPRPVHPQADRLQLRGDRRDRGTTTGLGGSANFGDWWTEPIVFQKLVALDDPLGDDRARVELDAAELPLPAADRRHPGLGAHRAPSACRRGPTRCRSPPAAAATSIDVAALPRRAGARRSRCCSPTARPRRRRSAATPRPRVGWTRR